MRKQEFRFQTHLPSPARRCSRSRPPLRRPRPLRFERLRVPVWNPYSRDRLGPAKSEDRKGGEGKTDANLTNFFSTCCALYPPPAGWVHPRLHRRFDIPGDPSRYPKISSVPPLFQQSQVLLARAFVSRGGRWDSNLTLSGVPTDRARTLRRLHSMAVVSNGHRVQLVESPA